MSRLARSSKFDPVTAWLALLTLAVAVLLIYKGAFTTTIGAGMVFADWPLSNGSLNPEGWTQDQAMFAEHSHRLLGALVGLLTIGLALALHVREARPWLRFLGWFSLGLVVFQGPLGGARVLMVNLDVAKIHGITGQLTFCALVALVVGTTKWWRTVPAWAPADESRFWSRQRIVGFAICGLLLAQLALGAIIRHRGAGLSIPYFPFSTADNQILPPSWNWAVTLHFLHRVGAVVICGAIMGWAIATWRSPVTGKAMKWIASLAVILLHAQIALGAGVIWSLRGHLETTFHVLNGAFLFAVCWTGTLAYLRPLLASERTLVQGKTSSVPPPASPVSASVVS